MPRLPMLSESEAAEIASKVGMPTTFTFQPIWRVLLTRPRFARAVNDLLTDLRFRSVLDNRLLELVIMRVSWLTGSSLEWSQHWLIATQAGIPVDDLLAVREWERSSRFNERDRCALSAADEIIRSGRVRPATWVLMTSLLADSELFELVALVATYQFLASVIASIGIPLENEVLEWLPDGVGPSRADS